MQRDMEGHIPYVLPHERIYMKEGSLKRIHVVRFYLWNVPNKQYYRDRKHQWLLGVQIEGKWQLSSWKPVTFNE